MPSLRKKQIRGTKSGVWALPPVARQLPVAPQPSAAPAASAVERRAFVRHFCDIGAVIDAWPARVHDISRGGVKAVVGRRFEVGTVLKLELPIAGEENLHMILARVIRVVQEPTGSWCLGCAFVQEISQEELEELLAVQEC
jgi:hypothetical protein